LLSVEGVDVAYGDVNVLSSVNFHVDAKEIVALVGANGAGKSTMINTISGINRPRNGRITFLGERIDGGKAHRIVERGIVQVPEGRRIFSSLTVLENLEMGSFLPRAKRRRKEALQEVYGLFPILKERKSQLAGTLSGGEQQMLAIGRALMSLPNLQGTTILIVEQNVEHTLEMADRAYVLENGSIVLEGTGKDLLENPHVKEAYLGI
jgi:branched-chain amino acid transport system ATP-binding protein